MPTEGERPASTDEPELVVVVRPVERRDLPAVARLIQPYVEGGKVLPRTRQELQALLPHGFVAILDGRIVGFVALEVYSAKLAEIRSLVVASDRQGRGIGKQLVEACVQRAKSRNVLEVMAITSNEEFFQRCGFDFTLPGEKKALFIHTRDMP